MKALGARFRHLLIECDTELAEFVSGLLVFGWGLFIRFPDPYAGPSLSVYRAMQATGVPIATWGLVITALGLVQSVGALMGSKRWRSTASFILAPFWTFVAGTVFVSGSTVPALWVYSLFSIICSISFIRLSAGSALLLFRRARRGAR